MSQVGFAYSILSFFLFLPGLRPAVSLMSLATVSSSDWMVTVMQYISLVNAGGSWVSFTEILGTLEMILQGMKGRLNFPFNLLTDSHILDPVGCGV